MAIKNLISQDMIDKYTEAGFWGDENVLDFLDKDSKLYGNKEAFVEGDIRITFNELLQNINRLANKFVEMGIKKEMIIGVQLPNCIEFIYTYYALSKIGAIALPIHTPLRKKEIEDIIDRFDCQLIIAPDEFRDFDFADMYQDILSTNSKLKHVIIASKLENLYNTC